HYLGTCSRGGLLRSSEEAGVMPVERRKQAIAIWIGSTGNGRNPISNGRRQPSCGGTSRMTRECHVRIWEGLGGKFPGPTRQPEPSRQRAVSSAMGLEADELRFRPEVSQVPSADIIWP